MAKEFSHLEYRCDLLKFGRVMNDELRANITENKLLLLGNTPFNSLFGAFYNGRIIESACRKSDMDIVSLLKCFDKEHGTFQFGEINDTISADYIGELFGLNVVGLEINLNQKKRKGDSEFVKRQFDGVKRLSKVILETKIKAVAKLRGLEDERDFVRLICLYFCVTLFFCNSGNDLSWFMIPYIEDLESMSRYAWAPAVKNYLDNSLISMNGRPESACGCLIGLLFWFCERTRFIEPIIGREEMKPTFLKWNLLELYARMKVVDIHQLKEIEQPQPLCAIGTPSNEKFELAITGTENVDSKEKYVEQFDTSKMFQLLPTQIDSDDGDAGPSATEMNGNEMEKRMEELVVLLEVERAKNKNLLSENERLHEEVNRLRPSKKMVENEGQTRKVSLVENDVQTRNLRLRSKCKEPSFLVDYITTKTKKGKEKVEVANKDDDDDDDFVVQSPFKKKKLALIDQIKGVRRLRVGKHMTVPNAQKLKDFLAKGNSWSPLWRGQKVQVVYKDVKAILNEEAVTVQAMDAYLEILSNQQPEEGDPLALFMSTIDWETVNGGDNTHGVEAYCEPFFDGVVDKDLVFLPMFHSKHQQFTLLVLNKEFQRWEHYNTLKPIKTASVDLCFEDATKLHVEISKHLAFLRESGESILKNKKIWKYVERRGEIKHFMYTVSAKDRNLINWLGRNNIEQYRIVSMKHCPKHGSSSVDSGIAVMYIIKQLWEAVDIESTFPKGAMAEQRADVLERFLNDKK